MALDSDRRIALTLGALVASATLLVSEGAITGSDGRSMYEVASSLVEHGTLTVDSALGVPGRHHAYYSRYAPGQSLVALIGYLAVRPIARLSPNPDLVEQAGAASMMGVIYGLLVAALYALARRLGAGPRTSVLTSIGAVAGTYLLPYAKEFFSEPLTALCLTVSIERAIAGRNMSAAAAVGAAGLARPQALGLAPLLMWNSWRQKGWRGLGRTLVPLAATACILLGYNLMRFGNPLNFGYEGYGFTTPVLSGMAGLLAHPAKSLFLFAPIAFVLPFALAYLLAWHPSAFWLIVWNFALVFIMGATWVSWVGGWAWGPRLLITGIAPSVAAVAPWCENSNVKKGIATLLFGLGTLVSAPALLVSTRAQQLDQPPPLIGPSVLRQYELVVSTAAHTRAHLFEYEKGTNREYLTLWQVGAARVLGERGLMLAMMLSLGLLAMATVSALRLRQALDQFETREGSRATPDSSGQQ